ncbi:NAD-dependent epimerase/dehydratase family protein [Microbacterium sp. Root180]|uniref:NAD-dependent epimerase/dehydratase family protein n=1 Tax=Microbacterium sp. Root180 TaxID=1736483 RepID=UPI000700572B|nr:NAD-dependent epimerase/dehydratase family protein [Microbacterium sp. Root180]KRB36253.1 GDP-mannose 4,6-dehydratase [Microbacterium sp. Root180]
MRILVTGGAGFIGANLVRRLNMHEPDWDVCVLDDLSTGSEANLEGVTAAFIHGSVADRDAVAAAVSGADAVVHLAALGSVPRSVNDPIASHVANLTGTLNVLEGARTQGAHVIFASSSSVYGSNPALPKSEFDWTRPLSPYAATKLGAEAYTIAYQKSYGLPTLAFRFFNVYGPLQAADHAYAAVVPRFVSAALSGDPLVVHSDGRQSRDFTFVDTVTETLHRAIADRVVSEHPVNLAFGTNTTLLELIDVLEDELGERLRVEHVEARAGDVRASQSDGVRIRELFPAVEPVGLREGVAATVEWFRQERR